MSEFSKNLVALIGVVLFITSLGAVSAALSIAYRRQPLGGIKSAFGETSEPDPNDGFTVVGFEFTDHNVNRDGVATILRFFPTREAAQTFADTHPLGDTFDFEIYTGRVVSNWSTHQRLWLATRFAHGLWYPELLSPEREW
jgi:hypothetical protein